MTKNDETGLSRWDTPTLEECLEACQEKIASMTKMVEDAEKEYAAEQASAKPRARKLQALTASLIAYREELDWQRQRAKFLLRMIVERDRYAAYLLQNGQNQPVFKNRGKTP